jgi:hypothetical protein
MVPAWAHAPLLDCYLGGHGREASPTASAEGKRLVRWRQQAAAGVLDKTGVFTPATAHYHGSSSGENRVTLFSAISCNIRRA